MSETPVPVARTVADLRRRVARWHAAGERVGLVPTMGALHRGHLALVAAAQAQCRRVAVSIFVNPRQFGAGEDLAAYPRPERDDLAQLAAARVDLAFVPPAAEIYPDGFATTVSLAGPALGLESDHRPGHFDGVATVVAKLFVQAAPDAAFFGEKDYQQLLVVRRLVRDLDLPVEIVGVPTVREPDGLALSSRNAYLSAAERQVAPRLHQVMRSAADAMRGGAAFVPTLERAKAALAEAGFAVDYLALRDAATLAPLAGIAHRPARLLAAARLGRTRLIDNIAVAPAE